VSCVDFTPIHVVASYEGRGVRAAARRPARHQGHPAA
jgi:hypothetical protein